jgi:hypothetical protein
MIMRVRGIWVSLLLLGLIGQVSDMAAGERRDIVRGINAKAATYIIVSMFI